MELDDGQGCNSRGGDNSSPSSVIAWVGTGQFGHWTGGHWSWNWTMDKDVTEEDEENSTSSSGIAA